MGKSVPDPTQTASPDGRMGERVSLSGHVSLQFRSRSGDLRRRRVPAGDLSCNAISVIVPDNDPILNDFGEIYGRNVRIRHPGLDMLTNRTIEAVLYRVNRLNSNSARWVFFFNRKISLAETDPSG